MRKNQFSKVKNSLLELRHRELKDKEVKLKRKLEEVFFKPFLVSIDNMDKLKEKKIKKIRPIQNTSYDSLINYISEPIRKL